MAEAVVGHWRGQVVGTEFWIGEGWTAPGDGIEVRESLWGRLIYSIISGVIASSAHDLRRKDGIVGTSRKRS